METTEIKYLVDWEEYYREEPVEAMPWFHEGLDKDFDAALNELGITGGAALDLGTGPGTQARALAKRGLTVTATDISATAVRDAAYAALEEGLEIDFLEDDILWTKLKKDFDVVLDRGCFHGITPEDRGLYVKTVFELLRPGGYLLLKCFSVKETMEEGPYRFTPEDIRALFGAHFKVKSIEESVFDGTLDHAPKALFIVMQR